MIDDRVSYRGTTISAVNGAEALPILVNAIEQHGAHRAPRGLPTKDLLDVTVIITDPADVFMYGINRAGYNARIGLAEGLLLVAGVSDPPLLRRIAPTFARFQDGGALHGAYGPRLFNQLSRVISRLRLDVDTRQAVATIWDPAYDLTTAHQLPRDVPCTVYLDFRVVDGALEIKIHMRSNDLWRGWCYDIVQFSLLQHQVARTLGLRVGPYTHHADSLHLYDIDREAALSVTFRSEREPIRELGMFDLPGGTDWSNVRNRAQSLLYDLGYVPANLTERLLRDAIIEEEDRK
jgi:thymidylate synthase